MVPIGTRKSHMVLSFIEIIVNTETKSTATIIEASSMLIQGHVKINKINLDNLKHGLPRYLFEIPFKLNVLQSGPTQYL